MERTTADKRARTDLGPLRARFKGALIAPGGEGWDEARQAFNLLLDQHPIVVAFPADEEDVASTVRFARERGLRVAPRRTGHGADPLGSLEGAILQLVSIEIRHLEGALARSEPHHGALSSLPASFATFALGLPGDAASIPARKAQLRLVNGALEDHDAGRFWNFTMEQLAAERFFSEETSRRLEAVKAQYDPEDTFQANQSIASR